MKEQKDVFQSNVIAAAKNLLNYWYVFALFLVLSLGSAFIYLKYSSKEYWIGSSILLRIEGTSNTYGGSTEVLKAFNFMLQDKTFQNEIFYLKSYPLIREVGRDLNYRVSYYEQAKNIPTRFSFARTNIYKNSPFWVVPREDHVQPVGLLFHVRILDDKQFRISAYSKEGVELHDLSIEQAVAYYSPYELEGVFAFGTQVETEKSSFSIALNGNFNPSLHIGKDFFFSFNNFNYLADYFKGSLSIEGQGLESTLAELKVKTDNIELGVDFLDKLIEKYIVNNMEEANFLANQTIEHIDHQLVKVSDDLTASEQQLQQIRTSHRVMDIEEKSQVIYSELQNVRLLRDEAQRRLNQLEELNNYFSENMESTGILAPSSLGLADPMLNNLIEELTTLNSERQRIISQDQIRNPRLVSLEISIENLKKVIQENLRYSINNSRNVIDNLNAEVNGLNREFAGLPGTQRQLLGIERRFNINDATYTFLLERRIQAQIIKASKLPDAKIIEPSRYAGVASPRRSLVMLMALMLGCGLPAGFFMGRDLIINRIKKKEDIKYLTSIPVIATIPQNPHSGVNVVIDFPRSLPSESFHILRSNLVYFMQGKQNQAILITSSIPGEGKSFSALNLAASFAMTNARTVLVEFDLRKPTNYVDVVQIKKHPGLSSYLIARASLEEIIIPTKIPGFDVIHSGQVPPNPIELIHSPRTEELIIQLKQMYDYVILDTPPYGLLSDPFVLMRYSDLNLYIARAGYTKKSVFLKNIEDIEGKQIDHLYIVMNEDKEERKGYGKYKYYQKDDVEKKGILTKKS